MSDETRRAAPQPDLILVALRELIEALDRRVPQAERVGEAELAREAAALREAAVTRIVELTAVGSARPASRPGTVVDDGDRLALPSIET